MLNLFGNNAPNRKQFNPKTFRNPNFPPPPPPPETKSTQLPSQDSFGQLVDLLKTFITQNAETIK